MSTANTLSQVSIHKTETLLFFTLLQLAIIVLCARIGGAIAVRLSQSRAVGEIIIGILLGPSLLGILSPEIFNYVFRSASPEPMMILSQIGLILLMFQIGLEFDFSHLTAQKNRNAVIKIAAAGMIIPFGIGYAFGYLVAPILSPQANQIASGLFTATAFSITALPILGRIMMEFDMTRTSIGVIAISAAAINDVIGWLLLAVVTALTFSDFSGSSFAIKIVMLFVYIFICWKLIRPLLKDMMHKLSAPKERLSGNFLGAILASIFISSMITYQIGIFAIFGGFILGVLLHDEHDFVAAWKKQIGKFVMVFFLPIFFTYTGLRTNIGGLNSAELWGWCLLLIALASAGKFGGCYLAARWSKLNHQESKIIGIMMNTRALMELIVINVGYDLGVISQNMFTMLVIMAIVSTVVTTPGLRRWLPKAGISIPPKQQFADI